MKKVFLLLLGLSATTVMAQDNAKADIKKSVMAFVNYGDRNDAKQLAFVLHDQHRLIWNDGKKTPFVADKQTYLSRNRVEGMGR